MQMKNADIYILHKNGGGGGLVIKSYPTLVTPWTVAHQAPSSMGFSRQEYCSGLPFPPPWGLPNPGTEPWSPALAGGFFTTDPPGIPIYKHRCILDRYITYRCNNM